MAADWFDLSGRIALVTGAGKGLGRTMARALATAGADVALVSRTLADLDGVAVEIESLGRRAFVVPGDVADEAQIESVIRDTIDHFGAIDILVNNAGIEGTNAVTEIDADEWDRVMAVNLRGPMLCCKHVGPHMAARGRGKVINVASVLASKAQRSMATYAATKAGLVQFTKVTALEWIAHNVQVNAICPGYFVTPMNEQFLGSAAGEKFISRLPARRVAQPDEIEGATVFLASDATRYITGTTLYVDGGHSLR